MVRRIIRSIIYFIAEGLKGLRGHLLMTLAAIGTIAAALLVTGCFGLAAVNVQYNMDQLMSDREFLAYLDDDLTSAQISLLGQELDALDGVETVEFISNKEALEIRQQEDSLTSTFFDSVDYTLLQNRYHIVVENAESLAACVEEVSVLEGVDHVYASYSLAQQIASLRVQVFRIVVVIVCLLALASIFIISNVVRLEIAAREDEIAIMRLVGATNSFIRGPFLVEGLLIGFVGGLLAFGLSSGLYLLIIRMLADGGGMIGLYDYDRLWLPLLLIELAAGLVTGSLGTLLSMRRALRT